MLLRFATALLGIVILAGAAEIPAGQVLEIRLAQATSTKTAKVGDPVRATLIAPVIVDGSIAIPQGAQVEGTISTVAKFGYGFKNSHARLGYRFDRLRMLDGSVVPIDTRLMRVDSAREHVDDLGQVHGIAPVVSASSALAFYAWRLVIIQPAVGAAIWGTKYIFAPAPDPEINLPRGTELLLKTLVHARVPDEPIHSPAGLLPDDVARKLRLVISELPQARVRRSSGEFGDRLNLLLIGSAQKLQSAFTAAGWVGADRRTPGTLFKLYLSVEKRQGSTTAPMAPMTFDGRQADLKFQKGLNTFSRRHHLRLWQTAYTLDGEPVWVGSATEDVEVSFSRSEKRWVHDIDLEIDNERTKVLNDLMFSGCINEAGLLQGAPITQPGIKTDGKLMTARFGSCDSPRMMPLAPPDGPKANVFARAFTALGHDIGQTNAMTLALATARIGPVAKAFLSSQKQGMKERSLLARQQASWLSARGGSD